MTNLTIPARNDVSTDVDGAWQTTYKVGGISLILTGIAFLVGIVLTIAKGEIPTPAPEMLTAVAGVKDLHQAENWVFVLSDLFALQVANILLYGLTLAIGLAMRGSAFSRFTTILGIVTGAPGLLGLTGGLFVPVFLEIVGLAALGWLIWFFTTGIELYQLG